MFRSEAIDAFNLSQYKKDIPEDYLDGIRGGRIGAAAVFDVIDGESIYFGLYLTELRSDWIRLIWIYAADRSLSVVEKGRYIRYCILSDKKRRGGTLRGAFAEIYPDGSWQDTEDALMLAGMEADRVLDNVYEFALSEVQGLSSFEKAAEVRKCICLARAEDELKERFRIAAENDRRPVPLPWEIHWEHYEPEISFICVKGEHAHVCGGLFFTEREGYLIAEVGYASDPLALPALLWNSCTAASGRYGPDTRILIPMVSDRYENMIKGIVPEAKRGEVINAVMRFHRP